MRGGEGSPSGSVRPQIEYFGTLLVIDNAAAAA
jgi:hypothetical protein